MIEQFYNLSDLTKDYSVFALIPVYFALIWLLIRVFKGGERDD